VSVLKYCFREQLGWLVRLRSAISRAHQAHHLLPPPTIIRSRLPGICITLMIGGPLLPITGWAQAIQNYFPSGVSGYDQQVGVTVVSRARQLFEAPGINLDSFIVSPHLAQSLFYNTSVNGTAGSGSWGTTTAASLSAFSNWTRDSLAVSAGVSRALFLSLPGEDYTNWNIGIRGGYTIGDSQLIGAYSHQVYYQLGTSIGTVRTDTPVLNQTDTAHVEYTFNLSRLAITPDISFSRYTFGSATLQGVPFNLSYLDRIVVAAAITGRYSLGEEGGLLVVLRGADSKFTNQLSGQLSNDSRGISILTGLDYQASGLWRYRILVGVETRSFKAAQFPTRTAPVVEGSVIWTPTGLTTVTGTLSREIEDPASAGTNGYVFTQARVVVNHEYKRNLLLEARTGIQNAEYLQTGGGSQTNFFIGASLNWLLNRNLRFSLDYDFTKQANGGGSTAVNVPGGVASISYTQSLAMLTLQVAF
jgi:hypothetical protein